MCAALWWQGRGVLVTALAKYGNLRGRAHLACDGDDLKLVIKAAPSQLIDTLSMAAMLLIGSCCRQGPLAAGVSQSPARAQDVRTYSS